MHGKFLSEDFLTIPAKFITSLEGDILSSNCNKSKLGVRKTSFKTNHRGRVERFFKVYRNSKLENYVQDSVIDKFKYL